MTTELRTEENVIREIKSPSNTWVVKLIRRGNDGVYIKYVAHNGLSVHEAKLSDIIRLIDKYCGDGNDCNGMWYRWHDPHVDSIDPIFGSIIRVMKYIPVGELPGLYVGHLEQIYSLCYKNKFYRMFAMWGGIWGDYRIWIIIAPPINNEMGAKWCSYCRSEFC